MPIVGAMQHACFSVFREDQLRAAWMAGAASGLQMALQARPQQPQAIGLLQQSAPSPVLASPQGMSLNDLRLESRRELERQRWIREERLRMREEEMRHLGGMGRVDEGVSIGSSHRDQGQARQLAGEEEEEEEEALRRARVRRREGWADRVMDRYPNFPR